MLIFNNLDVTLPKFRAGLCPCTKGIYSLALIINFAIESNKQP